MTTQIVLVPGFWLGAWAWDDVAPTLAEQGFDVAALTLPGLEEDEDTRRVDATIDDQTEAIVAALSPEADRRVLVAHSGSAFPASQAIDQHPELVDRLVLVDTAVPLDGTAMYPEREGDFIVDADWEGLEQGGSFVGLSDEQLAELRRRAVPQPAATATGTVRLSNPERGRVPVTVICSNYDSGAYQAYAAQGVPFIAGLNDHDVTWVDLPTGHWPMWSKPEELVQIIADAAQG